MPLHLPSPRPRAPWIRALRALWTLPTNLLGHAAGVAVSGGLGEAVRSPYAAARVYRIHVPGLGWVGGVTLGHAILLHRGYAGEHARLVLAHELAHTRQHEVLGPLYLPLHIVAQLLSAIVWRLRPRPGSDAVHAYNPLEERFLFFPHRELCALVRAGTFEREDVRSLLQALAL